ncbi:MAG: ribonuclease III [Bacteroidales bacterium]|nr:ribonuclease III [Candidatus Sodaliphilus aphodohippi]
MQFADLISLIKLLFIKDKELYVFVHSISGYYPKDISLYQLALVHRSKPVRLADGRWANNERLEYLGDAVLDLTVADYLYDTFPDKHEGFLTSTRAKIVQRESLNRLGYKLHIDAHVVASSHSTSHNSYICGNAVEALVGAIYLDQGYKRTRHFIIEKLIKKHFDLNELVKTEQNFKSRLIEWTQKYHVTIEFELVDTYNDKDNNPVFRTAIILGGIYAGDAQGYSKKESHQGVSRIVLERLKTDTIFRQQVLSTAAPQQ